MSRKVFLFKDNSEDRNCVAYIKNQPMRFECNHYFGSVILEGATWSGRDWNEIKYKDITTILTEEEFEQLRKFNNDIDKLGYGIEKGDERYNKGIELCNSIQNVYDKLNGEENQKLFEQVQKSEFEYIMSEYNLNERDVEEIVYSYGLEYRDRSIIGNVYVNTYELGYEIIYALGYIDGCSDILTNYIDYERFGEDLLIEDNYVELSDGRVVSLSY